VSYEQNRDGRFWLIELIKHEYIINLYLIMVIT